MILFIGYPGKASDIWPVNSLKYPPLIVTLALEMPAAEYFNRLREAHFPKHINYIGAHLTLFHHLPSDEPAVAAILEKIAGRAAFTLEVASVYHTGHGVAFSIASEALQEMHITLQQALNPWLIPQDRQPLRPHVTIQNKVTTFKARQLWEQLHADFRSFTVKATGLEAWHYLKGPWAAAGLYPFYS